MGANERPIYKEMGKVGDSFATQQKAPSFFVQTRSLSVTT